MASAAAAVLMALTRFLVALRWPDCESVGKNPITARAKPRMVRRAPNVARLVEAGWVFIGRVIFSLRIEKCSRSGRLTQWKGVHSPRIAKQSYGSAVPDCA